MQVVPSRSVGLPHPPAEFEGLTITPYASAKGRVAYSFRATGMRAPTGVEGSKTLPGTDTTARNAA
jgi:hypothetical protein